MSSAADVTVALKGWNTMSYSMHDCNLKALIVYINSVLPLKVKGTENAFMRGNSCLSYKKGVYSKRKDFAPVEQNLSF